MSPKTGKNDARAWTRYWAKQGDPSTGCLPQLPSAVAADLLAIWESFFALLPPRANLLELGCGNGVLLVQARAFRPDLRLTGVDYAATLPDPGSGIVLHPDTRMEELPFGDRSFDAVTGQFAIEYGNIELVIREVKRVLARDGRFLFICHHAEGIIVHDNKKRLAALRGLLGPGGLMETALKLLRKRKGKHVATRRKLAHIFALAVNKYDGQSAVHEVGEDIARILDQPERLKNLLLLRREVEMECLRLEALKNAAVTEKKLVELSTMLGSDGQQVAVDLLHAPGVAFPIAWRIGN